MNTNTYHHEDLKQELITAGLRLIAEEGLEHFSLRGVAAACNVSHAAPYKHFKNKTALLEAIGIHVQIAFGEYLKAALARIPDLKPHEKIVELGNAYVEFMLAHPDYMKYLFFNPTTGYLTTESLAKEQEPWKPLNVFCRTAVDYLDSIHADPAEYEYDIIAMWGMVHGLTLILANNNWKPGVPVREAVGKILAEKLVFQ